MKTTLQSNFRAIIPSLVRTLPNGQAELYQRICEQALEEITKTDQLWAGGFIPPGMEDKRFLRTLSVASHTEQVFRVNLLTCDILDVEIALRNQLSVAALLHDWGKIDGFEAWFDGDLTAEQRTVFRRRHSMYSARRFGEFRSLFPDGDEVFPRIQRIILNHHFPHREPDRKLAEQILILHVADMVAAQTEQRHRGKKSLEQIASEMDWEVVGNHPRVPTMDYGCFDREYRASVVAAALRAASRILECQNNCFFHNLPGSRKALALAVTA